MTQGQEIITSLHHLRELMAMPGKMNIFPGAMEHARINEHLNVVFRDDVPVYFIRDDVVQMVGGAGASASVSALVAMKLARLPFKDIIVEFKNNVFLVLRENLEPFNIEVKASDYVVLNGDIKTMLPVFEATFTAVLLLMIDNRVSVSTLFIADATGHGDVPILRLLPIMEAPSTFDETVMSMFSTCMLLVETGVRTLLLALTTDGVSKERRAPPEKLNKARKRRGKPSIPICTVLHLSHYHDRAGKRHSIGGTDRHVRLHLRAGHIRNQAHGKGRKDHKKIFIQPCVVNYRPEESVRAPIRDVRV